MDIEHDMQVFDDMFALFREPDSPEKDAQFAALIEEADADNLVHSRISGRALLSASAANIHNPDRTVGLLAESQSIWNENRAHVEPELLPLVLLQTMSVIAQLEFNYQVPAASIRPLCESYIEQSRSLGFSTHTPHRLAMLAAWNDGDTQAARQHFEQAMAEPVQEGMPELAFLDIAFLSESDDEAAVARYRQLVANATEDSDEPSDGSHSAALLPLLRTGNRDQADQALTQRDPEDPYADDVSYLALTGQLDEAVRRLVNLLDNSDDEDGLANLWCSKLEEGQHAALVLAHLSAAGHGAVVDPRLGEGTINDLLRHYTDQAEHYARKTDAVNGSQVQITRLHAFWDRHRPAPAAR